MNLLSCFFRDARSESLTIDEKVSIKENLLGFLHARRLADVPVYAYALKVRLDPSSKQ